MPAFAKIDPPVYLLWNYLQLLFYTLCFLKKLSSVKTSTPMSCSFILVCMALKLIASNSSRKVSEFAIADS